MTNTLHRYGSAESFYDDYVIFAIPSRGKNDKGSVPKLKQFLDMALPFKPVNLGTRSMAERCVRVATCRRRRTGIAI